MDPSNKYVMLVIGDEKDDEMHDDVEIEILVENKGKID